LGGKFKWKPHAGRVSVKTVEPDTRKMDIKTFGGRQGGGKEHAQWKATTGNTAE